MKSYMKSQKTYDNAELNMFRAQKAREKAYASNDPQ